MDTRKIIWTKKACAALDEIFQYIARDSEYHAAQFITKIKKEVEKLLLFPKMGKLLEEDDLKRARVLIIK